MIEALLSGISIISTDCESGPREILQNGKYGKLVPIKDPKILSFEIEKFLTSKKNINFVSNKINEI